MRDSLKQNIIINLLKQKHYLKTLFGRKNSKNTDTLNLQSKELNIRWENTRKGGNIWDMNMHYGNNFFLSNLSWLFSTEDLLSILKFEVLEFSIKGLLNAHIMFETNPKSLFCSKFLLWKFCLQKFLPMNGNLDRLEERKK